MDILHYFATTIAHIWNFNSLKQCGITFCVVLLQISFTTPTYCQEVSIDRKLAGISLGMTIEKTKSIFDLREKKDQMEQFTKGQQEIYLKYKKIGDIGTYDINNNLPPEISTLTVESLEGQVFQIILRYKNDHYKEVGWAAFAKPFVEKYGAAQETSTKRPTYFRWVDKMTQLLVAEEYEWESQQWHYKIRLTDVKIGQKASDFWNFASDSFEANKGNVAAQVNLGFDYYLGTGTPEDYGKAAQWWLEAAKQGDAKAQFWIGRMYYSGKGVKKDSQEAIHWYKKAAQQGYARAQTSLGYFYLKDKVGTKNYQSAFYWYLRAAKQGSYIAQHNIGEMYREGLGLVQDYVQAHMWYNLAASKGIEEAIKSRDELAKKMAPEQIAAAQKLAAEWKPQKEPIGREWKFSKDIDEDGFFTIDDVSGWIGWVFYYPGDSALNVILSSPNDSIARFFKLTKGDYGGALSFFVSFAVWTVVLFLGFFVVGLCYFAGEWIGELPGKGLGLIKKKWRSQKTRGKGAHDTDL